MLERGIALVTGGCGFIGTHLCSLLVEAGWKVRVLDLVKPTNPVPGVTYFVGDVACAPDLTQALSGVTAVCHLAAIASVPACQADILRSYSTNVQGTLIVLESFLKASAGATRPLRLVFASSAAVYGERGNSGKPLTESTDLAPPLSWYAAQKLASEHALRLYALHSGLETLSLRFFNVFGTGQNPKSQYSGVISRFLDQLGRGEPLTLHGGGVQTRDFVHVSDVVRAIGLALDAPAETCNGDALNIGTGTAISIKELAETLQVVSGRRVALLNAEARQGDVLHSKSDPSKADLLLKWQTRTSLHEGLAQLWDAAGFFQKETKRKVA